MAYEEEIRNLQKKYSLAAEPGATEGKTEGNFDINQMQQSILPPEAITNDSSGTGEGNYAEYKPQYPQTAPSASAISAPVAPGVQEYSDSAGQQAGYEDYQPYQSYSSGASPDMIGEIADQIISEKLSSIRKNIEKAVDARNSLTTKLDYLEERLKRIEKIIDSLQSSVLRRVGDYVNDVQEIKRELIETEKTLAKVIPATRKHSGENNHSHSEHSHTEHHGKHKKR